MLGVFTPHKLAKTTNQVSSFALLCFVLLLPEIVYQHEQVLLLVVMHRLLIAVASLVAGTSSRCAGFGPGSTWAQ